MKSALMYHKTRKCLIRIAITAVVIVGIGGAIAFSLSVENGREILGTTIVVLIFLSLIFYRPLSWIFRSLIPNYGKWDQESRGRRMVARRLAKLGDEYFIISNIKLPGLLGFYSKPTVDHVAIGPNGLFVIENEIRGGYVSYCDNCWSRKRVSKKGVWCESYIGNPSAQVSGKIAGLHKFLEECFPKVSNVQINGLVVFTNPTVHLEITRPEVPILKLKQLTKCIGDFKGKIEISKTEMHHLKKILENISVNTVFMETRKGT